MTKTNEKFVADVGDWVTRVKGGMIAVHREALKRTIRTMRTTSHSGGLLPFDTGFLRASWQSQLNSPAFAYTYRNSGGQSTASYDESQVTLVLGSMQAGDTFYGAFTATYARAQEYGFQSYAGRGFVRDAAQKWPATVNAVAAELKARLKL